MKKNRTVFAKKEQVTRNWFVVDAEGKILGRMSSRIAVYLRGKHKPVFSPHVDCGDFIVVVNAARVKLTGKKETQKMYFSHSGYPGGDRLFSFREMIKRNPKKIIRQAVAGMLPKNRLGRQMLRKLKVYLGAEHPHKAQNPQKLEV